MRLSLAIHSSGGRKRRVPRPPEPDYGELVTYPCAGGGIARNLSGTLHSVGGKRIKVVMAIPERQNSPIEWRGDQRVNHWRCSRLGQKACFHSRLPVWLLVSRIAQSSMPCFRMTHGGIRYLTSPGFFSLLPE